MKYLDQKTIHSMSVKELESEIRKHNKLYFEIHEPEISDYDFDQLVERLKKVNPKSPVLHEIGSDIRKGIVVPKITHTSLMLSLDKCYNVDDLMSWANKFEGDVVSSPKIDGCAIEIRYDDEGKIHFAATRGDGVKGEDVSANVRFVPDIPKMISIPNLEIRGEVYMPLSIFKKFETEFANPRNLAAGAIKQKQPSKTGSYQLSFFGYDIKNRKFKHEIDKIGLLQKLGFKTGETREIKKEKDKMQKEWDRFLEIRNKLDYEIDGVVFKANLIHEQDRLGASAHHPRWAIAYKFQGDSGTTTLQRVEWSVGRTGVITPIGMVDPVELSGAMVSRVSLHNYGMMKKIGVTVPSKVVLIRAGGVIPYLQKVLDQKGKPVEVPKKCPSCGCPTEIQEDFLRCTNVSGCRRPKLSELEHFVKAIEIDGFGEVLIEKLYDNGFVEDSADFYTLTKENLLELERMGEILATKLIGNIQSRKEVPLHLFLQSLGIRELAKHSSKILVKEFGVLEKILKAGEAELSAIYTIGPVIAREVVAGLKSKRPLIDKLLKQIKVESQPRASHKGVLQGKTFLFTGKLAAMERGEAEKSVAEHGAEIASGVSKDLDYLVIGSEGYKNREKGNKWIKAEKVINQGGKVKIISEEEFFEMINK